MCGIVSYIGFQSAYDVLIKGLKRLEYRGYDSAGLALIDNQGHLNIYKAKGRVSDLENATKNQNCKGTVGIAHTRWATHGVPSVKNAHPHCSQSGHLSLIHNGIIENYTSLKKHLIEKGYVFKSDTDTEVLVQLIEYKMKTYELDLIEATKSALKHVIGAYAIVILDDRNPYQLVASRKSSPLVIGIGEDNKEFFLASDVTPIVEYTDKVVYLEDERIAVIERNKDLFISDLENNVQIPDIQQIDLKLGQIEKGNYSHYMLKEISEQPQVIADCMRGRISPDHKHIILSAVIDYGYLLAKAKRIIIVACGTSWHAGLIGKQLIEEFCRIPVMVEYASEFRYSNPVVGPNDVVIAISQSGETADTLAAVQLAKEKGAFIFGICNAVGSSIPRATNTGCYIHVGPEIGVASTKAFTGQVTVLTMFALALGQKLGALDQSKYEEVIAELVLIPEKMKQTITRNELIKKLSCVFTYARNFIYLGRGYAYPVALEGALKLKEISYIHAEGYPAAEMKHGPIALVDKEMPVVCIATSNGQYEKVISNIQEIKARDGRVIAIVSDSDTEIRKIADDVIDIPSTIECLDPLLTVIPLQILAYHVAVLKGLDVDMPRNLAKSVTVE